MKRRFAVIGTNKPVLGVVRASGQAYAFIRARQLFGKTAVLRVFELRTPVPEIDDE